MLELEHELLRSFSLEAPGIPDLQNNVGDVVILNRTPFAA